jgi:hypothetical protein
MEMIELFLDSPIELQVLLLSILLVMVWSIFKQ